MIFFDLFDLRKLRRLVLYLLCVLLSVWLQTMVLSRVEILGAKPFFLPVLAVAIGLWDGGVWGGALGLVLGAYFDLCSAGSAVECMLLCTLFGFFTGLLGDFFLNRRFPAYLILAGAALVVTALVQALPLWIFRGTSPELLFPVALLQALWGLPFAVPVYFIVRRIAERETAR